MSEFGISFCLHEHFHGVKSVLIWSFSGPYFPAFGLNTGRYGVSLRIESECGKILSRKTPKTNTFHAMYVKEIDFILNSTQQVLFVSSLLSCI